MEALARALKFEAPFRAEAHPLFHPSRSATTTGGIVGELHPSVLEGRWSAFELFLDELASSAQEPVQYQEVGAFPPVRQDLAFVVDANVAAADLFEAAGVRMDQAAKRNNAAKAAIEAALFDAVGKTLGLPASALLGGAVRDRIPVLWTLALVRLISMPKELPVDRLPTAVKSFALVRSADKAL